MNIWVHVCIDYNPLIKACVVFLCNRSFCPKLLVIYCTYLELCASSYVAYVFCTCIKYEIEAFIWSNGHISNYEIFY